MNKALSQTLPKVILYTKAGCHLCDEARDMLDEIASEVSFLLDEVDIRSDMELFAQYRYRIPVIVRDETIIAEGRIDYEAIASAFGI
ncbi:glutaredoxin family protein [Ktedonospora formicarum]|uniref:Thioredoxin family protein n=1 Tax=Ktedonospora formicarum TaxID=2778364 RepID=A0A8J3I0V8_9CHLR|nr:glutaredoxin family protein [Ktedonospora formicarum]GHO45526.1 thioredoxin family protein [Ktedonospora formicarum]